MDYKNIKAIILDVDGVIFIRIHANQLLLIDDSIENIIVAEKCG